MLDRSQLLSDLRAAGVTSGSVWIVHSSFKSLGPVAGGPATVVAALIDAVSPGGTLLMPTFSDPQPDGVFDVLRTPSRVGAITEAFRITPGVLRSHHPTHSVSAIGTRAAEFLAGHDRVSGLGVDSPLHRAAQAGANVLMIGCDFHSASIVHVAEAIARVPYLGRVWYDGYDRPLTLVTPDGDRRLILPIDAPTCSANFDVIKTVLNEYRVLRRGRVGHAPTFSFRALDAIIAGRAMLNDYSGALLCSHPSCPVCSKARQLTGLDPSP